VGYNIHRNAVLRLVLNAGQNDFNYSCGDKQYFQGGVNVKAGQTTTVTLQPNGCVEPGPLAAPTLTPQQECEASGAPWYGHSGSGRCVEW